MKRLMPPHPGPLSFSVLLAATLLCGGVHAAEGKTFTVGVEDYKHFLPYSEVRNDQYGGLGRDILDAFARHKGYAFVYKIYPLKRRDRLFVDGLVDLAFPDNPNWVADLKKDVNISYAPMLEFTDGVLVRPENLGKGVGRLKTLGIPLGFTPYPYQQLMSSGALRIEETGDYDSLYDKLLAKRVDGAYMNTRIARHYWTRIRKAGQPPLVYDPDLPHASGQWYLSSHKYPQVIEEFRKFMLSNKAEIDELKKKYEFQAATDQ
ncbi:substrate-binding periplasmic protein [Pseudoduganella violacea]|uniref:ABC-type amino acid transport substrate-binding protein n=1 Tax=Pseudoduganella violacea TaxID=1715466 RepID=A0A7W5B863_9BURK|nr:transporter substrate-binding domain-containing protein [Pseudoduganella violacea]MBB3118332.1 ABC-type amino acid transport substrate-binding protein [Pseudoduganella violacea]